MSTSENATSLPRPLEDVTVLDITVALAGPFATLLLAGLGARVIKVEDPNNADSCRTNAPYLGAHGPRLTREEDDDISLSALNRLRNKFGVSLNLKHPGSKKILHSLIEKSDIVVENFSRGTLDRLGAGYDVVRSINPKAIYCSITGFGANVEAGSGKAMDAIIQALSGMMMTSGEPDHPPTRLGVPLADLTSPMFAVIGILAALHQAKRTGQGQLVDVSMLGTMTSLVACEHLDALEACGVPFRTGQTAPRLAPFGIYATRDGYIALCAPQDKFAQAALKVIGYHEPDADERFGTRNDRVRNNVDLDAIIEEWTRVRSSAQVLAEFEAGGVPVAPVRDPVTAVRDARVRDRKETVPLVHPKFGANGGFYGTGLPITFSASNVGFDRAAPSLGENNDEIYGDLLGFSLEQIAAWRESGVI